MRTVFRYALVFAAALLAARAQAPARHSGPAPPVRGTGQLYVTPAPGQVPRSLKELCAASSLIAEGVVEATLPSRETAPGGHRGHLETDAVISIRQTLKGPADTRRIVISQMGGTIGDLAVRPTQYSLVRPGELYVLFLTEDKRPGIPGVPAMKRYLIAGIWSGLFQFEGGKMRVDANELGSLRSKYQGLTEDLVLAAVREAMVP